MGHKDRELAKETKQQAKRMSNLMPGPDGNERWVPGSHKEGKIVSIKDTAKTVSTLFRRKK